jgi:hypothetical protein
MEPFASMDTLVILATRDGASWTLEIPRLEPWRQIRVDGEVVGNGGPDPVLLTVPGRPSVESFMRVEIRTAYRSLVDGAPDMSAREWEDEDARLLAASVAGPDGRSWPRMEDEIAHARHRRNYAPVSRAEWVKNGDVPLSVSDKVPEEPFLVPARMLGGHYSSAVATYDRPAFMMDWFARRLGALGMTQGSTKGRAHYQAYHLNGEVSLYLHGGFHRKVRAHVVSDTYATVRAMRDADADEMERWVSSWLANVSRPVNAAEVGQDLRDLAELLARLPVKAAGVPERAGILRRLRQVIGKVEAPPEAGAA